MKIKVAVAEDNKLLAESIKEKLDLFPDEIEYKFNGENGYEIIRRLENDNNVDVLLMDIQMPEMDGITAASIITERFPHIKIIMLTVFNDEQKIFDAVQAGAIGYLLKDEPPKKILESINMSVTGGAPMSPSVAAKTLLLLKDSSKITKDSTEVFDLTQREIEVLEKVSQGLDYKEIGKVLYISPSTVRKHIENIYRKMHVNNKMRAVKKAMQHKLI